MTSHAPEEPTSTLVAPEVDATQWSPEDDALISAASAHDITTLNALLKTCSAQIQEPKTLTTPLHAAVSSLRADSTPEEALGAAETVNILLLNGAIWNDVDSAGDTPGCIAWRIGGAVSSVYALLVEAGVRAELLLARFVELGSDDEEDVPADVNADKYLASKLEYDNDKLVDEETNGVMMAWETGIMRKSVEMLLPEGEERKGKRVLNVGFGMGIVDDAFQERLGADGEGEHYIVEAHPDVFVKMRKDGWMERKGVKVLEGRWQEVSFPFLHGFAA